MLRPDRKALVKVPACLTVYIATESALINGTAAIQVVHTDMEAAATGGGKQPLDRLGLHLNLFKRPLLFTGTAIGTIPVTVIRQLSPTLAGDAPVTDFMESAGEIAMGEDDLGIATGYASRQVFRLIATANQLRSRVFKEQSVEQCDKVFWTMIHGSVIVRL